MNKTGSLLEQSCNLIAWQSSSGELHTTMQTLTAGNLQAQARKKGTGARGLRSILESVLLEAQYHVNPRREALQ